MRSPRESQSLEANLNEGTVDPFEGLTRIEVDVTIEGTTILHLEPISHSISWCIQPHGTSDLASTRVLRPEDRVTITSPDGRALFDGPLTGTFHLLDPVRVYRTINEREPPPAGFVIYWSPQAVDPHTWLSFFEGRNNIQVHRHSTALIPPEHAATVAERMRVVGV